MVREAVSDGGRFGVYLKQSVIRTCFENHAHDQATRDDSERFNTVGRKASTSDAHTRRYDLL
jgi:hypothetical protein